MEYKYIKIDKQEYVATLTLDRPQKRNAFSPTMVNEIAHAFEDFNGDDAIKIVVIKSEGPIFCAGMDLKTFENPELDETNPKIINQNISLGEVFDSLHKPSIAIVEGNVLAGGFLIILGCTYVFCKKAVEFKLPELALGIFPFQVMASLLKVMPEKRVLQLCLDTNYFNADKAKDLGIVDGFLEDVSIENITQSFELVNAKALKAGISALRNVSDVPKKEQFAYLKKILDNLKEQ